MNQPSELPARRIDELFAQIGFKRQWIDRVLEMVKEKDIRTVFDPTSGAGHLPMAVGEEKEAGILRTCLGPYDLEHFFVWI